MNSDLIVNERIRARFIRLVEDEKLIGEFALNEALARARALSLDLVVISGGDVPVCRILDADRYRFERQRAERENARRQRETAVDVKEIQLRPVTDDNDLGIKARRARGFLDQGDKVRVTVRFRGREKSHKEQGREIISRFLAAVGEHKIEKPLSEQGEMAICIAPVVSKSQLLRRTKDAVSRQD